MTTNEQRFQDQLREAIEVAAEHPEDTGLDCVVETFQEAGVMTLNAGLVLALEDGRTFQLTIVQSGGPSDG